MIHVPDNIFTIVFSTHKRLRLTNDMSSNPAQVICTRYNMIKFVGDLRQVGCFLRVLRFPPPLKLTATI